MTFEIALGDPMQGAWQVDKITAIQEAAADRLPADAQKDQLDAEIARLLLHQLLSPRRAETARAHFRSLWPLISDLTAESFDHVITEFAEHLSGFR
jgi:hypothetical protein